ncbi:hypothetical protein HYV49_03960 [Candidatus Pacearchaeota archaeon]|nr:hypothetical protein [Candidatus Pacearchaeota archaeon]
MEFWNSLLTEESWKILQELNKKYNFILIGGWAVYLWTKNQKSKDIDIVVDILELQKLKQEHLIKNDRLKKYEIKRGEIDINIYVSHFSKLAIPAGDIKKYASKVEGFNVTIPELLLILKQRAFQEREYSVKGEKDKLDILSILFFTEFDFKKYFMIVKSYKLESYVRSLIRIISTFQDYARFSFILRELKLKKKFIIDELKKV